MSEKQIKASGAVVYWTLGRNYSREILMDMLTGTRWKKSVPNKRTRSKAIQCALQHIYADDRVLVRPLLNEDGKPTGGYTVVAEASGSEGNHYQTIVNTIIVDGATVVQAPLLFPADATNEILARVRIEEDVIDNGDITRMLTKGVDELNGLPLRETGGFYWLAEERLDDWAILTEAVKAAGVRAVTYLLRVEVGESEAKAVLDALVARVHAEVAEVRELAAGNNQKRAFDNRLKEIQATNKKIEEYERWLAVNLDGLREITKECRDNVLKSAATVFPTFKVA